jgi:hypothetical protein
MVSYSGTGVLVRVVADVFTQLLTQNSQKGSFRTWEKGLAYAAALIKIMVFSYFLLIFVPITLHR